MDPRNISLSLSSTDEAGHTTTFSSDFEGASAPWSDMHRIYAGTAEQIHKLVHVVPINPKGSPERNDTLHRPVHPNDAKLVAELNIDAGTSFVDETHPHAEALRRSFEGQLAKDYGVANMTPGEVQRLLEQKDREVGKLRHTVTELRLTVTELRLTVTRQQDEAKSKEDWLRKLRAKLEVYEAGAPGVAELQRKYNELMQRIHDGAMEDTNLQEERDIARKERDRAIRDLHDLQAVHDDLREAHNDLRDQFTDQTERLKDWQRELRTTIASKRSTEERLHTAAFQHGEALGKRLMEAVEEACSAIESDTGALSSEMIHKSDAVLYTKGITKRVAQNAAPSE